jgi:hypothetical protein
MEKEFYEAGKNYHYQVIEDKYKNFIFLRGMFEKFGQISKRNLLNSKLYCSIEIFNDDENNLSEYLNYFHLDVTDSKYIFKQLNDNIAFNFLINLYKNSDARYRDDKFYKLYIDWITIFSYTTPSVEIKLNSNKAVFPYKNNQSDIGMNLTIIKEYKKINLSTIIYDTGVIAIADFGFCIKVIPHNDLILKGYMLLLYESEGKQNETIKIVLIKTDRNVKLPSLPYCCCKMIIEKNIYYEVEKLKKME